MAALSGGFGSDISGHGFPLGGAEGGTVATAAEGEGEPFITVG